MTTKMKLAIASVALCVLHASADQLAYVPVSGAVDVIDIDTHAVSGIPLGAVPAEMALTPDGQFAYVALPATTAGQINNTVAVVSTASKSVVATIAVGDEPSGVAITPDGQFVYVSNAEWNSVWVIATATNSVVATIVTGNTPYEIAMSPQGDFVYSANYGSNSISVISTASNSVTKTIPLTGSTLYLVISADGKRLYAQSGSGIAVIDTATDSVLSNITLPSAPSGLVITPDGHFLYTVTGQYFTGFFVSVIDTSSGTVVATIPEPVAGTAELAMTPDGTQVYVSNRYAQTLTVISTATNTVLNSIPTGSNPSAVVFVTSPVAAPALISFNPTNVAGGASTTGTVILSAAAPAGGAAVSLTSNAFAVSVPASVVVPAGSKTVNFPVTTFAVANEYPVTVTATYNGASVTAQITLSPVGQVSVSSVSVNPVEVAGGVTANGTVTLSGPAPAGGVSVELWTNGAPAFVPMSIAIPAGSTTGSFPVTTNWEPSVMEGTLTAFYNGFSRTAAITVTPEPTLLSLSINPTIAQLVRTVGTVTLTEPAPVGGAVVYMWTSGTVASVPVSVFLPAGQLVVPFTVTPASVSVATQATITAFYLGASTTQTITINP